MISGCDGCRVLPRKERDNAKKHQDRGDRRGRSTDPHRLQRRRWRDGGGGDLDARGDITIWYSNNEGEIEWGKQMVEAWNADHPDEQVKAQEIPAGDSSEAVIGAAITAGNAPCLIFNTSPGGRAAVREGGRARLAVELRGRRRLHHRAQRRQRGAVRVGGRRVLPDAVEVQPGRDLLQQGDVHRGGPRPRGAGAVDVRRVPRHLPHADRVRRRAVRDLPVARRASSSSRGSTSTRCTGRRRAARCSSRTARRPSIPRPALPCRSSGRPCTRRASPARSRSTATRSSTATRR